MTRSLSIHLVLAEHRQAGTGLGAPTSALQSRQGALLHIRCPYAGPIPACLTVKGLGCLQRAGVLGLYSSHATGGAAEAATQSALTVTVPASWELGLWQEDSRHWVSSAGWGQLPSSSVAPGRSSGCLTQGLPRRQDVGPGPLQASVSLFHGSALATPTGPFNVCGTCGCVQGMSGKQNP